MSKLRSFKSLSLTGRILFVYNFFIKPHFRWSEASQHGPYKEPLFIVEMFLFLQVAAPSSSWGNAYWHLFDVKETWVFEFVK